MPDDTVEKLKARFPEAVLEVKDFRGETTVKVRPENLLEVGRFLREEQQYDLLIHVTGVDYLNYMNGRGARFEAVYNLYSVPRHERLRLKVPLAGEPPTAPSVTGIWPGANWHEREAYDLLGIVFEGHPDLRRIMMPDDWVGHPLHKDYPLGGEPAAFSVNTDETLGQQIMDAPTRESSLPPWVDTENHMVLNMGPQHPATHGVLRVVMELDGERVISANPDIGHLHSGIEKTAEYKTYQQVIPYTDRMDYVSAMTNNLGYILAVEKLLGIESPPRAQALRVICGELQRIACLLIAIGTNCLDVSGTIHALLLYTFREREEILNLFEMISGARLTPTYFCIGGVRWDAPPHFADRVRAFLADFPRRLEEYETMLLQNPIWLSRTKGIGVISAEEAIAMGMTGPCLRASGVPHDARKYAPYCGYEQYDFEVSVAQGGDCYDRLGVRLFDMKQSARIIEQALDKLPAGPIKHPDAKISLPPRQELDTSMEGLIHHFKLVTEGFSPPEGEVYACVESPKGEIGYYLVSDGSPHPYRLKIRGPAFSNLQALNVMSRGAMFADMVAIIGAIDITLGEVDR